MRSRWAAALALALIVLLVPAPASAADGDDPGFGERLRDCFSWNQFSSGLCVGGEAAGEVGERLDGTPVGRLADAANALSSAAETISSFSPQNMVDEWAKNIGEFAVTTVGWISERAVQITAPQFGNDNWLRMYAVSAGLGLLLFAGTLILAGARVARSTRDRVDHAQLLRDAGISAWLVPTVIIMGPALLVLLGESIASVGAVFSEQVREGEATERMGNLVEPLVSSAGDWAPLGGAFGAIVIFAVVALMGLYVLLMLYFVSEAQLLFALFLPLALAMWVYAPWRAMTRRILAGLVALMLMPTVLQFVFWAVWTRVGTAEITGIDAAIRLLVGLALLATVPTLTMMFLPKMMPDGGAAPSAGLSMGSGAVGGALVTRMLMNQSRRTGTSKNRPIGQASPSQTPSSPTAATKTRTPAVTDGGAKGAATKGAGAKTGAGAAAGAGAKTGAGAATKGAGAKTGAGAAAGPVGGAAVASVAAVAMGAKALKQAGQGATTSSMGVAETGGDGGGRRPSDQ